jgi:DNA-binding NarL/FixJ family response regulator/anti-sigma regulatory factor (Ser/Thr protein kinase)
MPIILVVDDSEVDRTLMAGLLSADFDWLISHAKNGVEALEMISDATPDAVVTDLMMPEMDGMQLVSRLAESFPELPVVLVTGQDDAQLALKALRHGAASFVPKTQLTERLLDTVEQVLAVRDLDHYDERIVQITTNTRYRFELDNDPSLIAPLVDRVQLGMTGMQLCSPAQRMHVGIALEEALINAMCHGNLELPVHHLTELRKLLHEGKPSELVEERRKQSPYQERRIHVAADFTRNRAQIVVGDDGAGFDVQASLPKSADEVMEGEGHRGLLLIQTFMDEVIFNQTGNEMRMTLKDLRPIAGPTRKS